MNVVVLVLVPALAGAVAFFLRADTFRRALLVLAALVHAGLVATTWVVQPSPSLSGWLRLDRLGQVFLSITSALFLAAALYAVGYLRRERQAAHQDFEEGLLFTNAPEATFT